MNRKMALVMNFNPTTSSTASGPLVILVQYFLETQNSSE
ncbi:hypothetical protein LEP1GSC172_0020 [Leptospira noguchii]|uniref:Uncharacterized protein n=1 Tax=Leptospira noguchii TaxID=28182 RepID=M6V4S1_9LEPT|nr:hypothetical protein LEP1GSC172_0020 [Leptospira noguchii]